MREAIRGHHRSSARTVYAGSWMNLGWSVTSGGTKQSELHTSATRHAGTLPRRRARPSQMGSEAAPDEGGNQRSFEAI